MKKIVLLLNTIKYLKPTQFYNRILRKFVKPKVSDSNTSKMNERSSKWIHLELYAEKIDNTYTATFLNHKQKLTFPQSWNDESHSKLWVYNLHYFEELMTFNAKQKSDFHLSLIDQWINDNPTGFGNGWEPYTLSLRISNVIKAWLGGLELREHHFKSVFEQASFLSNDLEKHLLGNHLFVNLKALLFAGVMFKNKRWLNIAVNGLIKEIPEQILSDGGNFELTPMYHNLILVDMLDMKNLSLAYPNLIPLKLKQIIDDNIPNMLSFKSYMQHSDGEVSFFNDSAMGIAPAPNLIDDYASLLGFESCPPNSSSNYLKDLEASGYMVAQNENSKLIFDAANVGPDYIPGHAHADTLSFELSIGDQRVFVNSGTSQYGISEQRHLERQTRSHNTVEIDGKDSSQVWSGFRVANRARVRNRDCRTVDEKHILFASHDGYKSALGGAIHSRQVSLGIDNLVIEDTIKGKFSKAEAHFYIHPDLDVILDTNKFIAESKQFKLTANLAKNNVRLLDSEWHPEFGLSRPNKCLVIEFESPMQTVEFNWNMK